MSPKQLADGKLQFVVPLSSLGAAAAAPGISGKVRLEVSAWS
jgi:hypothetical protein